MLPSRQDAGRLHLSFSLRRIRAPDHRFREAQQRAKQQVEAHDEQKKEDGQHDAPPFKGLGRAMQAAWRPNESIPIDIDEQRELSGLRRPLGSSLTRLQRGLSGLYLQFPNP